MISVLGLKLETAQSRLAEAGYTVRVCRVSPKKGESGGDVRVVRQTKEADGGVLLTVSGFVTELFE
ncbi:MAG: hypothetical protein Q4C04_05995 [Clostridia bacterium]|nr:hypothetical protein [Clostridia bacterium]